MKMVPLPNFKRKLWKANKAELYKMWRFTREHRLEEYRKLCEEEIQNRIDTDSGHGGV